MPERKEWPTIPLIGIGLVAMALVGSVFVKDCMVSLDSQNWQDREQETRERVIENTRGMIQLREDGESYEVDRSLPIKLADR